MLFFLTGNGPRPASRLGRFAIFESQEQHVVLEMDMIHHVVGLFGRADIEGVPRPTGALRQDASCEDRSFLVIKNRREHARLQAAAARQDR